MGINLILAIGAAVAAGALVVIVMLIVTRNAREKDPETKYRGQLDAILSASDEYEDFEEHVERTTIIDRWNRSWGGNLGEISGAFSKDDARGGILAIVVWAAIVAATTVFIQVPLAGVAIASVVLFVAHIALKLRGAKRDEQIRQQLTGFLFAMKANISASETPERSLMKVIEVTASPLQDELIIAKNQILANVGFTEAMINLREETTSEDLRFLCSCMIQATSTGVSLETQIDIILKAVEQKKRTTEEIAQAVKPANMSMYASAVIIPAGFIGVYILDERAREYWFVDPTSWIALLVAAGISAIGVRQARKFVSKVREL